MLAGAVLGAKARTRHVVIALALLDDGLVTLKGQLQIGCTCGDVAGCLSAGRTHTCSGSGVAQSISMSAFPRGVMCGKSVRSISVQVKMQQQLDLEWSEHSRSMEPRGTGGKDEYFFSGQL